MRGVEEVDRITQFYFAMEIRGLERRLLGNRGEPRGRGGSNKC